MAEEHIKMGFCENDDEHDCAENHVIEKLYKCGDMCLCADCAITYHN